VEKLELGASTSLSTFKRALEGRHWGRPPSQENMGVKPLSILSSIEERT